MTRETAERDAMMLDAIKGRTYPVEFHGEDGVFHGTGFVISHKGIEYLVTAAHVVNGVRDRWWMKVFVDGAWRQNYLLSLVGLGPALYKRSLQIDVAVLKLKPPLPVSPGVPTSPAVPEPGQSVYMLGFPSREGDLSDGRAQEPPALTVEHGTFMGFNFEGSRMLIEGTAAKGMSGGPIVLIPEDQESNELRVVGVLAGLECPIPTPSVVHAYGIRHAITAIDRNPGGYRPSAESRVVLT